MRSKITPVVQDTPDEPSFIEAARRAQIILCAIETLADLGYQHASLAEIAKRARISKSVISYYFAGKDELIDQIVADVYATARAFMGPRLEPNKTPRAMLRAYFIENVAFMRAYPNHLRAMVEIAFNRRPDESTPAISEPLREGSLADVMAVLRWGQETGDFRAFDVTIVALTIRSAIDAVTAHISINPGIDLDRCGIELADLFDAATINPEKRTRRSKP